MNFRKEAKPGKIMPQPPKDPNSGKLDSQIFIGKEDPQHTSKKKKKKKKKANDEENITVEAKVGSKELVGLFTRFAEATEGTFEGLYEGDISDYESQVEMLNKAVLLGMPSKDEEVSEEDLAKAVDLINTAMDGIDKTYGDISVEAKKKDKKDKEVKKDKKEEKDSDDWDPNPWAVCTKSVGDKAGTTERSEWDEETKEKYERCVIDVKKNQAFNLDKFRKEANSNKSEGASD